MRKLILIEQAVSIFVFLILLIYTYATLVKDPYLGFYFNTVNGQIVALFIDEKDGGLHVGDSLQQVGPVTWDHYRSDQRQPLIEDQLPGETVEIIANRDGEILSIQWQLPGKNPAEFRSRLFNIWWLSYLFWLAGFIAALVIRPIDIRQKLLIAFLFVTALWLMLGGVGSSHFWNSAVLFRLAIWLALPIYLHFHWVFPAPLRQISISYWVPLYILGIVMAAAEWFQFLPPNAYFIGFSLALVGSIILIILHFILKREQRRNIAILGFMVLLAFLPIIVASIVRLAGSAEAGLTLSLLGLAGLPGVYLYIAYRRQQGWLEVRSNRAVGFYIFLVLILVANFLLISWTVRNDPQIANLYTYLILIIANTFLAIYTFPLFQRLVEKSLLGMPLDRTRLVESYVARITTSLDRQNLVHMLQAELMPSLQIMQSSLALSSGGNVRILYADGITAEQVPDLQHFNELGEVKDRSSRLPDGYFSWIYLVVPLRLDGEMLGLWFFGRHDPEDVYSHDDIRLLELIGNQTAIAMANIMQTEQLRMLYETNVERQEEERTALARTLHDDILNNLAVLQMYHREGEAQFEETYEGLVLQIRNLIHGLRPAMLDYGLWRALEELVDDFHDRIAKDVSIKLNLPKSDIRYQPGIEQHLYRIAQQALENTIEHAQPKTIQLSGHLKQDEALILIEDDGIGLPNAEHLAMANLLKDHHYGLVGMYERASIIGADLKLISEPGSYTRVQVLLTFPNSETALEENAD